MQIFIYFVIVYFFYEKSSLAEKFIDTSFLFGLWQIKIGRKFFH